MDKAAAKVASVSGAHDLQEMWTALLSCDWTSLAVVPTDDGISVQEVVDALAAAARTAAMPVRQIDARGVDIAESKRLSGEMSSAIRSKARVVVVVDSLVRSLSGVHLIHGVNAILLVLRVGAMDLEALTNTVSMVGPARIVGSVTAPVLTDG